MKLKLFLLTILSVVGLMFPSNSLATSNLSVRLGQPKSPTNQNSLELTFVALEIGGTANITVDCYKKSPSDASFVKFADKTLIPGGNTDYCAVDSGILGTNGTYNFKVVANGYLESDVVTVDFNTSGPSTPHSYSKERINACEYKIKFKTADDGKTAKVELFRSETNTISVNATGRVSTLIIGPNTEGDFVNSIPNCEKDFYYVIRAVDSSDNVSGTTGDSNTITTTITTTSTNTPTQRALLAGSGSQVAEGTTQTEETLSSTGEEASTESATPEVLGTETIKYSYLKWIILTVIAFVIFQFLTHKKRA